MKSITLSLFISLISFCSWGQKVTPTISWEKTFDTAVVTSKIFLTQKGDILVLGHTQPDAKGLCDGWMAKYSATGKKMWEKFYGEEQAADMITCGIETKDGGLALGGYTSSARGKGKTDAWLMKLDAQGNVKWDTTYGGKKDDRITAVLETSDGGFALNGYTDSKGRGEEDFWMLKLDAKGTLKWEATDGGGKTDVSYSILETPDKGFLLAGYSIAAYGYGGKDVYLVKFDSAGTKKFDKIRGGARDDIAYGIYPQGDTSYAIYATNESKKDYMSGWVVRINHTCKKWLGEGIFPTGTLCQHLPLIPMSVVRAQDGSFWVGGKGFVFNKELKSDEDMLIVHVDENGKEKEYFTYGALSTDDEVKCIAEAPDGGVFVAGKKGNKATLLRFGKPEGQ